MQTNPAVEQNKNIKWSKSPWNQSWRKGKGPRTTEEGFAEEPSLKFRMIDWTSKRRWKWWWWTVVCDRRLRLTKLAKISG